MGQLARLACLARCAKNSNSLELQAPKYRAATPGKTSLNIPLTLLLSLEWAKQVIVRCHRRQWLTWGYSLTILTLHLSRDKPPHRLAWCRTAGRLPWVLYFPKSRGDIAIRHHVFRSLRPRGRKFSGCALKAQNWYNFRVPFRVNCEMQPFTLNCKHN